MGKRWTDQDDNYLKARYSVDGVELCAQYLGRTKHATWARTNMLKLRHPRVHPEHIYMDRVKTPQFAYILGYLWADGSLTKKGNGICLGIVHDDGVAIKPHINHTGTWCQRKAKRQTKNAQDKCIYTVWDKRFTSLLRELGYGEKNQRPFNLACEFLGPDLVPYFVHGFFDGDGCITTRVQNEICTITFAAPLAYDWAYLEKVLREAGIQTIYTYQSHKVKNTGSHLYFRRQEDVLRFYRHFIYHPEVGLSRKRERFEAFAKRIAAKYQSSPARDNLEKRQRAYRPDLAAKTEQIKADLAHVMATRSA